MQALHWNDRDGIWLDYDYLNNKQRRYFAVSNFAPLWTMSFDQRNVPYLSKKIMNYIKETCLKRYPGGVPTTFYRTGEQWDYPNVWPPTQYILIKGLENLGSPESVELSRLWAHQWIKSNFVAYQTTQNMFEKVKDSLFRQQIRIHLLTFISLFLSFSLV